MNLIDWLRRLGILRFGAESGVYHNAKERPTSLQMNGVFDSKKDVVHFGPHSDEYQVSPGSTPRSDRNT